jgi:hypothetical protein
MNRTSLVSLLLLGACAPSTANSVTSASAPSALRIDSQGGTKQVNVGMAAPIALANTVPVSMDLAWARLPGAFATVGLPAGVATESERVLTVGPIEVSRRLGGARLSTYLSCGESLTGPNADSHSVNLTIASQLHDAGSGATRVETRVQATATPRASGGGPVACSSTGKLENRLAAEIQKPQ